MRGWILTGAGAAGLIAAVAASPTHARAAADQVWSPFVLVAGLLLIGLVAHHDGVFAAAGQLLARTTRSGLVLFAGATVTITVVTAVLNLDTAVAFLTPVLVYTARVRGGDERPLLYACILLANAGSLFLPGSNLTNLIVLGHLHLTGGQFLSRMWAAALTSVVITAAVVVLLERRSLRVWSDDVPMTTPSMGRVGLPAVIAGSLLVLALRSPAIPVAGVGVVAALLSRQSVGQVKKVLALPVLLGLFGVAVALGTLGRSWSGPATFLSHLDSWGTAAVAATSSVLLNNLPAAALLAARHPHHPYSLLVGLDVGPNLFVSGSLAWFLWWQSAVTVGAKPSLARATRLGLVAAPLALVASVAVLGAR